MPEAKEIVAIFEVNQGVFAAIGVVMSLNGAVTSWDPRSNPKNLATFTNQPKVALEMFQESVRMSIESGSNLVYSGPKNRG